MPLAVTDWTNSRREILIVLRLLFSERADEAVLVRSPALRNSCSGHVPCEVALFDGVGTNLAPRHSAVAATFHQLILHRD
jgi:hypothetical protein